jgi:hypothetical protein
MTEATYQEAGCLGRKALTVNIGHGAAQIGAA